MKKINSRKIEHRQIANDEAIHFHELTTGFEDYHFIHNALPEIDFGEIDIRTDFLGYQLKVPLMISSISGGDARSLALNKDLAVAASQAGIALMLGSIRPALENKDCLGSYRIARDMAPDIPIIANIGASQIVKQYKTQQLIKVLKQIGADALSIHLNPLQEALQPEGEPHFKGVSRAIEILRETLPYPIIVKEVGFGLSLDVIKRLQKMGIQWIDVAGAGGTSWSRIEHHRTVSEEKRAVAAQFFEWGIATTEAIRNALKAKQLNIIASGGIDTGLKFAKAIALGAEIAGAAKSFLQTWNRDGVPGICELIRIFAETLRIAMFCTGCQNLEKFRGNKAIITYRK